MDGETGRFPQQRYVAALLVPRVGEMCAMSNPALPWVVTDGAGQPVGPASDFLRHRWRRRTARRRAGRTPLPDTYQRHDQSGAFTELAGLAASECFTEHEAEALNALTRIVIVTGKDLRSLEPNGHVARREKAGECVTVE